MSSMISSLQPFVQAVWTRWGAVAAGTLAAALLVLAVEALPRVQAVWTTWEHLDAQRDRLRAGQKLLTRYPDLRHQQAALQQRLANLAVEAGPDTSLTGAFTALHALAEAEGITVAELRPGARRRHGAHRVQAATMRVEGAFPQVVRFARGIETNGRPMRITGLAIDASSWQGSPTEGSPIQGSSTQGSPAQASQNGPSGRSAVTATVYLHLMALTDAPSSRSLLPLSGHTP
jgi:Tfp pilus assembly protein PilO